VADKISTTLNTLLNRVVEDSIDAIAKEGLELLKSVLDSSGFSKSQYLKNYQLYAHVSGSTITYEVLVSLESLDEESQKEVLSEENKEEDTKPRRSYAYMIGNVGRMYQLDDSRRDARKPARDARSNKTSALKSALDVRRTSNMRDVLHQIRSVSPRSIRVQRSGKISVRLKNYVQEKKSEIVIPTKKYDGVVSEFVNRLSLTVSKSFAPQLVSIISRKLK